MQEQEQAGITLVALVITVIILLILAGVAMSLITGQNGLFARANRAGYEYNTAAYVEKGQVEDLQGYLEQYDKSGANQQEKSDLDKLKEYFAKGPGVFYWYDEQTYEGGFNDVEPIMDASTSIHEVGGNDDYLFIEYNENYYKVNGDTMEVLPVTDEEIEEIEERLEEQLLVAISNSYPQCSKDNQELHIFDNNLYLYNRNTDEVQKINNVDLNTFGIYTIEGFGDVLVTPSSLPQYTVHSDYERRTWTHPETGVEYDAYVCETSYNWIDVYDATTGNVIYQRHELV